jgi:hypothetical protein
MSRAGLRWSGAESFEYPADGVFRELRVTEVPVGVDPIVVRSAAALLVDVARGGEVGDDSLCLPHGDADCRGDRARGDVRGAGDLEEHVGVVGQEEPGATFSLDLRHLSRSMHLVSMVGSEVA